MTAVRVGALRGRWSRWWSRLSPVIHASRNGSMIRIVSISGGTSRIGTITFHEIVWPKTWLSSPA